MDESITICVNILLKILPHKMNQLHTLARIFDPSIHYYAGKILLCLWNTLVLCFTFWYK